MNKITITIENPDNTYTRTIERTFVDENMANDGLDCLAIRNLIAELEEEELYGNNN